jgi:hypothetical protein
MCSENILKGTCGEKKYSVYISLSQVSVHIFYLATVYLQRPNCASGSNKPSELKP